VSETESSVEHSPDEVKRGFLAAWHRAPLYLRILGGLILGVGVGVVLGPNAADLAIPSKIILQLLSVLAPPLILIAVVHALITAQLKGPMVGRLVFLLLLNTFVAILVGLFVANVVRPGRWSHLEPPHKASILDAARNPSERALLETLEHYGYAPASQREAPLSQFLDNVPKSLLGPLTDNGKVLGVIFLAVAFGVALRRFREHPLRTLEDAVDIAFGALLILLHWIIDLVPLGVFGLIASIVGKNGFAPFKALGMFILAVLLALLLQSTYYLLRVRLGTWVRPFALVRGCRDALVMAFSTASSTATMPVTYSCLRDRVGLREESASMGSLVGSNFNNDGTALYEAMSALFISQMIGVSLGLPSQVWVVLTSIVASVGAAGIPEAGLVTMTLVFSAVGLPPAYIGLLLTVDWFLDRCRTAINVMGDMNVSCMLDGKKPLKG
jgi:DAACS family dicarboxylate/amino acid:cation (Na+ or H+) symporter